MNTIPSEELFPVVDENGNQISVATRSTCHDGKSMLLHPVVHLHLFNTKGELYLQKRALTKDLLPGYWDTSVGGHISPGEKPEEALLREAQEELDISDFSYSFIRMYIWESPRERELVYSFKTISDTVPAVNSDEIDEGRYWPVIELIENLNTNIFTPNFVAEFNFMYNHKYL